MMSSFDKKQHLRQTKKKQRHLLPFFTMVDNQVLLHLRILASFLAHLIQHGNTVGAGFVNVFLHVHLMLHMEKQTSWRVFLHIFANQPNLIFPLDHDYGRFSGIFGVTCHLQLLETQFDPAFSPFTRASESSLAAQTTTQSSRLRFPSVSCLGWRQNSHFFFWKKADGKKSQWIIFKCFFVAKKTQQRCSKSYSNHTISSNLKRSKGHFGWGNSLPPSYTQRLLASTQDTSVLLGLSMKPILFRTL